MTRKGQGAERGIARRTPGRRPRRGLRSGRQRSPGRWASLRADVGVRAKHGPIDAVSIGAPRVSDAWSVARCSTGPALVSAIRCFTGDSRRRALPGLLAGPAARHVAAADDNLSSQRRWQTAAPTRRSATRCISTPATRWPRCCSPGRSDSGDLSTRCACSDAHGQTASKCAGLRGGSPSQQSRRHLALLVPPAATSATPGQHTGWERMQLRGTDDCFRRDPTAGPRRRARLLSCAGGSPS